MKSVFSSPFKVYLLLIGFALLGIFSGYKLPISLYPNSSKPTVYGSISYGNLTADEFRKQYGSDIESAIMAYSSGDLVVDNLFATYRQSGARYAVDFRWGADPKEARIAINNLLTSLSGRWPTEIRDNFWVGINNDNSGFVAISYYSEKRTPDELYELINPLISPELQKVADADNPGLWNPAQKEVRIELDKMAMTTLGIFPRDIEQALQKTLISYKGGSFLLGEKKLDIQLERSVNSVEDVQRVLVETPERKFIPLSKVARVSLIESSSNKRIYKTNGAKSLILFATPKSGGNIKKMAEDILDIVENISLPADVQYKVLVDPSQFIRESVNNVMREVGLAACIAVLVLFLFLGNLKNTITAAIEIPLSMVLAFLCMRFANMSINLISLGGLALSAGMNVDASVVVMENIFCHMEKIDRRLTFAERIELIIKSVKEVVLPVMASTIASLVVFLPLAFTSDLTNAILGDLAKAVVFSHGFSAFVALILVPTVRLHILNHSGGMEKFSLPPINNQIEWVERTYTKLLEKFIVGRYAKWATVGTLTVVLILLSVFVVPKLKKEIIGLPDTDWMILGISVSGNSMIEQMDTKMSTVEADVLKKFGKKIQYTFTQIHDPNNANIMARLKDKGEIDKVWRDMQKYFKNTPDTYYWFERWNPAELPIPNPPEIKIAVKGGTSEDRRMLASAINQVLQEKEVFPEMYTKPNSGVNSEVVMRPSWERWAELSKIGVSFSPYDLIDLTRVATDGKNLGQMTIQNKTREIFLRYPPGAIRNREELEAFPIRIGEKILPLRAFFSMELKQSKALSYSENGQLLFLLEGRENRGEEYKAPASLKKAKKLLAKFDKEQLPKINFEEKPYYVFEDAKKELNDALEQLGIAVALSILLIFLTLLFQFGNFAHTLIILTAIPTGVVGVIVSLAIFGSSLSLNSILGVILLSGLAVNNSIILVDFIKRLHEEGHPPLEAAVLAAKRRLRPILITSLTTILGMLPIALGLGEGGKILQPLGIAVSGGLWFSMLFTLFIVPMLEVLFLNFQNKNGKVA
ncbi:MAG: hypothetical protein A2504_10210 [Bdellovibrionales bacterium RIFOXYD12_FULL_39_22]|nr:MAG: hypothetical protein A2385_00025 [Bdellovibrionales bacterium RIFOXYB1_FULL_39_21]OFZ43311.1 MAG: hypothetical protein A2485_03915 [Bdellovibrionales bacterium RIFOXYC12_FULL_39_17]OFZ45109.1 MAG: hypothetical protein A2404_16160 [Bdellovibrionales bacterium RIFOXYC1_FULL_39_130]OFZ75305.1 MAG: hypothetical protein A2560_03890 [Bdellovibrionales bacterium RIFOXYD1_FULL_39_84]OFZ94971.1 MAG: hypothetical protein A2504_10210 [Bdellovibrionales bacterium RIFOXYD12_FULL_39_22]HLE12269.1 ef